MSISVSFLVRVAHDQPEMAASSFVVLAAQGVFLSRYGYACSRITHVLGRDESNEQTTYVLSLEPAGVDHVLECIVDVTAVASIIIRIAVNNLLDRELCEAVSC
jgi:hypothetical protein